MKKRLLSVLLAVLMLCSLAPGAPAAELTPVSSCNIDAQTYHRGGRSYDAPGGNRTQNQNANPVDSYLIEQDGGFCRVEYVRGKTPQLVVETYSADRTILSQKTLEIELPLFGGFFAGEDANYFVFGQDQSTETGNDAEEVIRVVKYSKDFKRLGSVSIHGSNTTVPFDAGSLRMVEDGAYLYVHTCHEMYQSKKDGLNHQANLTFVVRKSDLKVTDIRSAVASSSVGYVSHSFNQFVLLDEGKLVTLDHGDARPRTAFLYRCSAADGSGTCLPSLSNGKRGESVDLMTFPSTEEHYNYTGASFGGLVATATHYIAVGASVDPNAENLSLNDSQRNIFVCSVPKDAFRNGSVRTWWLTRYPTGVSNRDAARVSTPHLVALPDGRALVLWTLEDTLYYQVLAANGQPSGKVMSREGALSDCAPTVIRGLVQWYVTWYDAPTFYSIDLSELPSDPFSDVPQGEYYYDPVVWAVNHVPQITNGTGPTTFSPNATCTRGQVVTFLWRAMGCPEPKSTKNPFTDVKADDYYYKPVLWAVEKGITNGTSATAFSPNSPCTRAHVVTFLWRAHQEPAAGKTNPFTDVPAGQYYTDAVLWAVSKNITNGTSATAFSPGKPCTRGQIVTFLYRDLAKS